MECIWQGPRCGPQFSVSDIDPSLCVHTNLCMTHVYNQSQEGLVW